MPVIALNTVVLPAPLGPMMEKICPFSTTRSTAFTAVIPPNRIVRLVTVKTAIGSRGYSVESLFRDSCRCAPHPAKRRAASASDARRRVRGTRHNPTNVSLGGLGRVARRVAFHFRPRRRFALFLARLGV